AKYPLNITSLRRAFAYAFNKTEVSDTVFDGRSYPIDSPLPAANPWSIEGEVGYSYYDAQINMANSILNDSGFEDIDIDGWREAPDGSDFSIVIEVSSTGGVNNEIGQRAASALQALSIPASYQSTEFNVLISAVYNHGDFDIVFLGKNFYDYNPEWLITEYGSDYYMNYSLNPSNWRNATFDMWIDQLENDATYAGVNQAVEEMQKIIIHSCPEVMIYTSLYLTAYRNDRFEHQILSASTGAYSSWTNLNTRLKTTEGGPFGGTLRIAIPTEIESFNFMTASSTSAKTVLDNLYMSLLKYGPDGSILPWLAESISIETHQDNATIPLGHTRFTINIIQNATWSDGIPVTAEDVAYTFNYYIESSLYGNPMGADLANLVTSVQVSNYTALLEFSTESYWYLDHFAFDYIIPKHVFTVIGYSGWSSWNPVKSSDPHVTCGPFTVTAYSAGDFVELSAYPDYAYAVSHNLPPTISGPDAITVVEGSRDNVLVWTAFDTNPVVYFILQDGVQVVGDFWYGGDITYSFTAPAAPAFINFTAVVWDAEAQFAIHTVNVTVIPDTYTPQILTSPGDITIEELSTGNFLTWEVYDDNMESYSVYKDGILYISDDWNSTSISISVDGFGIGIYNFTLLVQDINLQTTVSTVFVQVIDSTPPAINHPADISTTNSSVSVTWEVSDNHPSTYIVFLDAVELTSGSWSSETPITIDLTDLTVGTYNVTIQFFDDSNNYVVDTVMVTIEETTTTDGGIDAVMLMTIGGSLALVLIIAIIIIRNRR
ncbi:MAG: ABC transporter substrate-binding protein, partial [Candidatus Thorarchaeota archaeon]